MKKSLLAALYISLVLVGCGREVEVTFPPTPKPATEMVEELEEHLPEGVVVGLVLDQNGQPIADAIVRLQTTEIFTLSDEEGFFRLDELELSEPKSITAWQEGYFINNAIASKVEQSITIVLHEISITDNVHYSWLESISANGEGEDQGCAACHSATKDEPLGMLPVDEWLLDVHSQSAVNQRFLSVYNGTDTLGNKSPDTVFFPSSPTSRNQSGYSYVALPVDESMPYFGPGYRIDYPESAGNCGACHVPGEAAKPGKGFSANPNLVEDAEQEGVFCDLCHKVWDVILEPDTKLPNENSPGVLSFDFRRPAEGHQFFAGPYDDVAPGEDTYSSIQNESAYCAACHFGVFWNERIYNSYGEWLESNYSDPESGQTCQNCHMPSRGASYFALPSSGGLERDPETIFSHRMPGAMDVEFLRDGLSLDSAVEYVKGGVSVIVEIRNDNTGHKYPTDYPGRQLILLVEARGPDDQPLKLREGDTLPEWVGVGDPDKGYYSNLPGRAYAIILKEVWTGKTPTIAYWNPFEIISDTRIDPHEIAVSEFLFERPDTGEVEINIRLIFRRNFIEVLDWKQWDSPDILVEELEIGLAQP